MTMLETFHTAAKAVTVDFTYAATRQNPKGLSIVSHGIAWVRCFSAAV